MRFGHLLEGHNCGECLNQSGWHKCIMVQSLKSMALRQLWIGKREKVWTMELIPEANNSRRVEMESTGVTDRKVEVCGVEGETGVVEISCSMHVSHPGTRVLGVRGLTKHSHPSPLLHTRKAAQTCLGHTTMDKASPKRDN